MKTIMSLTKLQSLLTISTIFLLLTINLTTCDELHKQDHTFSKPISKSQLGLTQTREKLSHLHFYFHDIVSGNRPTAVRVAAAPTTNASPTGFGFIAVIDDPLTLTPNPTSKIVGRAQGIYSSADMNRVGLLMAMNFAFIDGKFNGSTLSVLGRNQVMNEVRELPVVGGSGVFRFARGYAQARTVQYDLKTGDAVVEYNVYVFHY